MKKIVFNLKALFEVKFLWLHGLESTLVLEIYMHTQKALEQIKIPFGMRLSMLSGFIYTSLNIYSYIYLHKEFFSF